MFCCPSPSEGDRNALHNNKTQVYGRCVEHHDVRVDIGWTGGPLSLVQDARDHDACWSFVSTCPFHRKLTATDMASIGSVTRQIAALEISSKKPANPPPTRPTHSKQPSQTNVAKLLTKYAAPPNPVPKPAQPSALRNQTNAENKTTAPPSTTKPVAKPSTIDIGKYDGGFEIDNEKRGQKVYGEAAEDLALDSSVSRYVRLWSCPPRS